MKKYGTYIIARVFGMTLIYQLLLVSQAVMLTVGSISGSIPLPAAVLGWIVCLIMGRAAVQLLYRPYKETKKVYQLFLEGYVMKDLFHLHHPFSAEAERVNLKLEEILHSQERMSLLKKQAQYLALQNQINPHFLYNTLEGIRSEAIYAGVDSVAKMSEALATFFRYTISNVENLVYLEDEIANVENYYIIQQYRFGDRLDLQVFYDEESNDEYELEKMKIPKLTLQPIVENSIYHGIERKVGQGHLKIKVMATLTRLRILISDDGLGMEADQVNRLNEKLRTTSIEDDQDQGIKRGGIAIANVNNRIKLLFGDEYGIMVYSKKNAGTDVEITLPIVRD